MSDPTTANPVRALGGPLLTRALLLLAFGALSMFWQPGRYWSFEHPSLTQVAWVTGIFLLVHGVVLLILQQRLAPLAAEISAGGRSVSALNSAALLYALGGVLAIALHGSLGLMVLVLGGVYALAGLIELLVGFRLGAEGPLSRDMRMSGMITMLTGMGLLWFGELGPQTLFGILGGGAVVVGIFLMIGAVSLRRPTPPPTRREERDEAGDVD